MSALRSRVESKVLADRLAGLSPVVTAAIQQMRSAAYLQGEVPAKYKLLSAAAISVALRCEPCIRAYVEWAGKKGATKTELVEFLNVAMAMQGCPGEEWSLKALGAWEELIEGSATRAAGSTEDLVDPGCCSTPES
jgi:AhpD family alkylhydroperoxidase